MMKKACLFACALLFVSAAGFAQPPSHAPLSPEVLAAILGPPARSCGTPRVLFAKTPIHTSATCSVTCPSGTISCPINTVNCTATDRDCTTLEPGHIVCDGVTTSCTPACCTGGTIQQNACCRCDATGSCFDCCRCDGGTIRGCSLDCGG